jgi:branched-chain amino acid transport system substrate-binding protein
MEAGGVSADDYSSPTATGLYAALQLFAKANANIGDNPTKADALAAMYTLKGETLDGLLPPVTFTSGQRAPYRPCFWPYTLDGGTFTNPLGGLKYECYPPAS